MKTLKPLGGLAALGTHGLRQAELKFETHPEANRALRRLSKRLGINEDFDAITLWAFIGMRLASTQPEFKPGSKNRPRGRPRGSFKKNFQEAELQRIKNVRKFARATGMQESRACSIVAKILVERGELTGDPNSEARKLRRHLKAYDQMWKKRLVDALIGPVPGTKK